jgi:Putative esterase
MRWMRALLLAAAFLPSGWTHVTTGLDGGTVWSGRIANQFAAWDRRPSAVYLPPGFSRGKRYPVVYLLHGMRGSPSEFWDALDIADVSDRLISSGQARPFIAVMPVAGPLVDPDGGEWVGVWEDYVVDDVGGNHGAVLMGWSVSFAHELHTLRLPFELWRLPQADRGHFWGTTFPSALLYASAGFRA